MLAQHPVHRGPQRTLVGDLGEALSAHDGLGGVTRAIHLLEHVLRDLAADGAVVDQGEQPGQVGGRDRAGADRAVVVGRKLAEQLVEHPVGDALGLSPRARRRLEVVGQAASLGQEVGLVGGEGVGGLEARAPGLRQLGQARPHLFHPGRLHVERRQVGLGEVAVVVGELLRAHRDGHHPVGIPEARLLHDPLVGVERAALPLDLVLQRVADVTERVHVLDLDLGPVLGLPARPERDVGVAAQGALLHVPVAHPEVDHDGAQGSEIRGGLVGAAQVGLGDDLHQRHAGPVVVHAAGLGGLERALVEQLAHVLLEVHALDADLPRARARVDN